MKENLDKYKKYFSEAKLWKTLKQRARHVGIETVYMVLLLYFAYTRKDTPSWAKGRILGTLGYFLLPFDLLADLWPVIGYTDDVLILGVCVGTIAVHINDDVKQNARTKLKDWFGNYDESELSEVDKKL